MQQLYKTASQYIVSSQPRNKLKMKKRYCLSLNSDVKCANKNFVSWKIGGQAGGKLHQTEDGTIVYAYYGSHVQNVVIPSYGGCFGFVHMGKIQVEDLEGKVKWQLGEGQYFSTQSGVVLNQVVGRTTNPEQKVNVLIVQKVNYKGFHVAGGPIEERGRLRYIDGCSDSILVYPPVCGDPCFNHLHFPQNTDQTQHTHPSVRVGIVCQGEGDCVTPQSSIKLEEGDIFVIPTNSVHSFKTGRDESMDVISYHPDSDWGPKHEDHPMINKTIVNAYSPNHSQY
eukprot:TRINITY_DN6890_c0_g1_i1.p1 TRINITY_DN6890_c0_g1~~TRINITY_DN6890_c0_g1_i1.p1  ORF type:complete len:282 (+),score=26.99 TRINITY_DN6890_c0_g1_i1:165-1010(+)